MSVEIFNIFTTIGALLIGVFGLLSILYSLFSKRPLKIFSYIHGKAYVFGLLITLGAVVMSLVYSNVYDYPPCVLCWYQRIFIYPQALIFALAIVKKYPKVFVGQISMFLTLAGGLFALYHTMITYTGFDPLPCPATASCTQRYVFTLGFSTIPLMSLFLFIGLFSLSYALIRSSRPQLSTGN